MLKRWSLDLNLTARSASLSLRVSAETLIPSAAVESRRLSGCLKLRRFRLLPWIKFKAPSAPPFPPPPKRLRTLSKIGFLRSIRKIRLFRRRTILPATPSPTDNEYELPRRSLSPRSPNSRKAAAAAAAVASLWAVAVAWILSERIRRWCGPGPSPGQCSFLSSLNVLFSSK